MRISSLVHNRIVAVVSLVVAAAGLLPVASISPAEAAGSPAATVSGSGLFAIGERLVYDVDWNPPWYLFFLPPMEAGKATLSLAEGTQYQGRRALKIIFTARSSGTLTKMAGITIDDYYEFTTDAETFCTFCVTKREREGKRMRDIDLVYMPDRRQLHLREVDVSTPVHRVLRDTDYDGIPPCVKDLFSALYSVRQTNLEAGSLTRVLVGENQTVKEVEVRVEKQERVSTPMGDYNAWRVNTIAVLGGLFKSGGQFRMWLSADERRMPVKFEAKVSLGKVTGSLQEAHFGSWIADFGFESRLLGRITCEFVGDKIHSPESEFSKRRRRP